MGNNLMLLVGLVVVTSVLLFTFNDLEKKPEVKIENNVSKNVCPDGYNILAKAGGEVCYNPSPLGHTFVPLFQVVAFMMSLVMIGGILFDSVRTFYSHKIMFLKNKYQDELKPVPVCPDVFDIRGFTWTYGGYSANYLPSSRNNVLYVSMSAMVRRIGNNSLFTGSARMISKKSLLLLLKNDRVLYDMMVSGMGDNLTVFFNEPVSEREMKNTYSLYGNYPIGTDRFMSVIETILKMRQGIDYVQDAMVKSSNKLMSAGYRLSQAAANISEGVMDTVYGGREREPRKDIREKEQEREEL